ncbi:MAG: DUF1501 domain-containing protein [Pirellulales bacterium]|nr:DUF1501 domain-containing protein [Pirellulales bacterium]
MFQHAHRRPCPVPLAARRQFLQRMGLGFTNLALGAILAKDGYLRAEAAPSIPPDGKPHFQPRAKSVIWIFLCGGLSHLESFDPKPAVTKYAGQTIAETPYKDTLDSPYLKKNVREFVAGRHKVQPKLYPLQVGHAPRGQNGLEMSDWFPELGQCADDLTIVRSLWTTDNDHGAQLQFHTGRHALEGAFPTIGSWVHYGLGSLNDNLPQFVVLGGALADCCGGVGGHGANYLGPEHSGVTLSVDPANPLPFAKPSRPISREDQRAEFDLIRDLNQLSADGQPADPALAARIKSYELAFEMQAAIPGVVDLTPEPAHIRELYGLDQEATQVLGRQCLVARRLVEQGTRFVQIFHGANGGAGEWDAHGKLKEGHTRLCGQIDRPVAALLRDLKQRGMLNETIVVLATEFGRTPGAEGGDGRDHHPFGFSILLAGGGIRGGLAHGKTDEIGFHSIEDRHYVTDIHATVLHQLGLEPRKLEIPGRKRLEIDYGQPIRQILS